MYFLYHHPFCPFSRQARIHLAAKEIEFELILEKFWERAEDFIAINPAGNLPLLVDDSSDFAISHSSVIIEYIEEKYDNGRTFLGFTPEEKAATRNIQFWFDNKFYHEVTKYILEERYFNRYLSARAAPNSEIMRVAKSNLPTHLNYIQYLLETNRYLACDVITVADFAAAAQISTLDYFGDINWAHYNSAKEWYSMIKSHKMFLEILKDRIPGIMPVEYYSKLDF